MKKLNQELKEKKLFLLDIDGTISFESELFDGFLEFMEQVEKQKGHCVFITNNSTKSRTDYVEKFAKMGVETNEDSFLTSSYATAQYLKERYRNENVFVAGTKSFIKELKYYGVKGTEDKTNKDCKAVVVGFDNELTYQKIYDVCELLQTGAYDYIATNPDYACPVGFGFIPDCGAICSMIEYAVKKKPFFIGKPNPVMVNMAMERYGCKKQETVVIGDRLYTDIAAGNNAGVDTVLVFTGEAQKKDLSDTKFKPSYYTDNIRQIYESLINE